MHIRQVVPYLLLIVLIGGILGGLGHSHDPCHADEIETCSVCALAEAPVIASYPTYVVAEPSFDATWQPTEALSWVSTVRQRIHGERAPPALS